MFRHLRLPLLALALALVACGQPSGGAGEPPTATLPDGVLARRTCGGGVTGGIRTTVVHDDGYVELLDGDPESETVEHVTHAPADALRGLRSALATEEWRGLDARYGEVMPDDTSCFVEGGGRGVELLYGERPAIVDAVSHSFSSIESAGEGVIIMVRETRRGKTHWLQVYADGTVKLWRGVWDEGEVVRAARVAPGEVRALRSELAAVNWGALLEAYGDQSAPDRLPSYAIIGNHALIVYDGLEMPQELRTLYEHLRHLWTVAERGAPPATRRRPARGEVTAP